MVGPDLYTHSEEQENVILSAAASPIQTRTSAGRRPKDLDSALGPQAAGARTVDPRITLLIARYGAAEGTGPSVAAKLCGRRGLRAAATLRMTF